MLRYTARVYWTCSTSSMASRKPQSIRRKRPKWANSASLCHFRRAFQCGFAYTCGRIQNLILPSRIFLGVGSAPWYFHRSDISRFYFLSNCTAWCVLSGFHENVSLILTMLQLWRNMEIHFEPVHSWVDWNNRNWKTGRKCESGRSKLNLLCNTVPSWGRIPNTKIPNTLCVHVHITLK